MPVAAINISNSQGASPTLSPEKAVPLSPTDAKTQNALEKIQEFFANIRRSHMYGTSSRVIPIVTYASSGVKQSAEFIEHVSNIFPLVASDNEKESSSIFARMARSPTIMKAGAGLKLGGGAVVGVSSIYGIIAESIEIVAEVKKGRVHESVDAGLRLVEAVGNLGESIASFTQGIAMLNPAIGAVLWATPLGIASAALSSVSIAINVSDLLRSKKLSSKLDEKEEEVLSYLEHELTNAKTGDADFFLKRNFEVINREKYSAQILHIIHSKENIPDEAIPLEKHKVAKKEMIGALKDRIKDKITSHKLAIAAAVIGLIGVLLLFCPFLGPVILGLGLAFVLAASAISFGKYILEYRSVHRLEKKLDELCNFNAIPLHKLPKYAKPLQDPPPVKNRGTEARVDFKHFPLAQQPFIVVPPCA